MEKKSFTGKFTKKIILDTSTLIYDALAFSVFDSSDIYIPFSVLEEIDTFKRDMGEKGRNARQFNCFIDNLRNKGSLVEGVLLDSGSCLYVCRDLPSPIPELDLSKVDHRILATALYLKKQNSSDHVELVTRDINLRIKADVFGIPAKDYEPGQTPDFEDLYTGVRSLNVDSGQVQKFREKKFLPVENGKCYPNQYVILENKSEKTLGRYDDKKKQIVPVYQPTEPVWGVHPRNREQHFALDALMNDNLMFVSLLGKAGTGKTLLALAVGLYKTLEENSFQKLLVSRPVFPLGRDIGYLPGDIEQKLNPWMQPIFDSIEFLMGLGKKASHLAQDLMNQGLVNVEPLAYMRGRSIPHQYLIVDEAQNLTPHEIKTVLTRAGQGTKVILTGDCYQIDNPYVDSSNNGLTFSVEKFKTSALSSHVTLTKGERSELAELAANIL
ncbi:MAG: PhoH family protein [Bdellovibrionales bacterium]|nr:PhoH family protein [Bdellovibrionales bacterium]